MNKDANRLIEAWLISPDAFDFIDCNATEMLAALDARLVNAWEHQCEAEREALLRLRERVINYQESELQKMDAQLARQPMLDSVSGVRCFKTLSQAVSFITGQIEQGAASELAAQFAHVQRPGQARPDFAEYFTARIFPRLQICHQELDLRERYQGKHFPEDESRFKLGGHMQELGCLHIDFSRTDQGWVIDSIWECR